MSEDRRWGDCNPWAWSSCQSAANAENATTNAQVVAEENAQAARPRTLANYNRPDQYYANKSAIRPPTLQRNDFELKHAYFTLVGQTPIHGHPHEHHMDHLEQFKNIVSIIKANRVSEDYLLCKLFNYSLSKDASH